ncbi:hypothetical protein VTP01DRAFT_3979 [Rhizomucor pusillus]|uniref:uncharacterized protein n=1 Tax=Rhizomucor pusillus TaxID=4840 RepID=UPI0037437D87
MTSSAQRSNSRGKRAVFSFGDEDEDDETLRSNLQPLTKTAVDRSAFTSPHFDPDQFLSSRRHLGLERLKVELNNHLRYLKTELFELINRDYQDFINLSTNLKGVDRTIDDLRRPLLKMGTKAEQARDHFQATIDDLESQLRYRAEIREKKTSLKLYLNIHDSVSKIEKLLEINANAENTGEPASSQVSGSDKSLGKQIERVAIEFNQMQHLVGRAKDSPFMAENEWRIKRIKDTLQNKLSRSLSSSLREIQAGKTSASTTHALTQCLRTYALIDQTRVAEDLIREEFVRPFLAKTMTKRVLDPPRSDDAPSTHPLTVLYGKLLSFATNDLQPILDIAQKTLRGTSYEVVVNSFWTELVDRINKDFSGIYAPGQTDTFHKNYTASISFVSNLESLCSSKKSLVYFRQHPRYTEFMKRWQLPVYFQLRFREIVNIVEDVLSNSKLTIPTDKIEQRKEEGLVLPASKAVIKAVEQCWSDRVFLYGLSHRFWKLTLQLLKRYNLWVSNVMQNELDSSSAGTGKEKKETADEMLFVVLAYDVETFVTVSRDKIDALALPKLPEGSQDSTSLKDSVDAILHKLQDSAIPDIQRRITNIISRRCIEHLKLVRNITSQYRHTNRQPPTEHSNFIPNIFKPFTTFIDQYATWIDDQKRALWGSMVAEVVLTRYHSIITELLTSIKKMEDSLKRMKKGRKTGSANSPSTGQQGNMTDEDKIRLQILLDVCQIGQELNALKVDCTAFRPYQRLYEVVKPYEPLKSLR